MDISSIYTTYVVYKGAGDSDVIESVYCGRDYQHAKQHALRWERQPCIRRVSILCHDEQVLQEFHRHTHEHAGRRMRR